MRCLLLLVGLLVASATPATSEDFRIATKIFVADDQEPSAENLTLFRAGVVYDVLQSSPREIAILDPARGRIALLDPSRRQRAEITTRELTEFIAAARQKSREEGNALLRFLADPRFETQRAEKAPHLVLESQWVTYTVTSRQVEAAVAAQYREFADWSAQLNMLTHPGTLPAFGRLVVNLELAKQRALPDEVRLEFHSEALDLSPTRLRSAHEFQPRLLASDQREIDEIASQLVAFQLVELPAYLQRSTAIGQR